MELKQPYMQYIVLIHCLNSYVVLSFSSQPKSAGVLLMGTGGRINPKSVEYMETACSIDEDKVLHPFAFRTHTHALGWFTRFILSAPVLI